MTDNYYLTLRRCLKEMFGDSNKTFVPCRGNLRSVYRTRYCMVEYPMGTLKAALPASLM